MNPNEILTGIVFVVGLIGGILTSLTIGAFVKHRKTVVRIEKRRALHKLYPDVHRAEPSSGGVKSHESELAGASH
jgi:hypothetical protein